MFRPAATGISKLVELTQKVDGPEIVPAIAAAFTVILNVEVEVPQVVVTL